MTHPRNWKPENPVKTRQICSVVLCGEKSASGIVDKKGVKGFAIPTSKSGPVLQTSKKLVSAHRLGAGAPDKLCKYSMELLDVDA